MVVLKDVYADYHAQGLEIIAISLDSPDRREHVDKFLAEHSIPWRTICDGKGFKGRLAKAYKVNAVPFTLLIGRDGKIAAVNLHGDVLEDAIVQALG